MNDPLVNDGLTPGWILFVVLVVAVYIAGVASAGYRRQWLMAVMMMVVLGVPLGLVIGGEGVTGVMAIAGTLIMGWIAWRVGRNFRTAP